ncbi:nitrate/nitrite sensor protein NarX [Nocardioides dokdonensis FR1436]|uniref:Nitrate/nitrite sensor protein NarX n=1 Tax=Nocardioides dokdonensis FR1436 TaxID=1300347 RepID=A0A1A9GEP2_9ACTN|nr:ATP-binding protein [Nocardioides dokdonensis]ANH36738.1 nitrate/nitrite sensor protein NarX [Nocardioides dokdonensis FR1436]
MTQTPQLRDPVHPAPRQAFRDTQDLVVGGVAAGLARHLGAPVLWVRVGFLVAAAAGGLGVALYAGLWLVLPADTRFEREAPGLEGARRGGRRPGRRRRRLGDVGPAVALAALGLGVLLSLEAVLGRGAFLWPVVIGLVGVALLWRQADEAQRERWLDTTGSIAPLRVVLGSGGWASYARVVLGLLLVALAVVLVALLGGAGTVARDLFLAALLGVVGIAVVVGPWVYRLAFDLTAEREERVRSQERADVAAHLHDSVLQTLALIQRSADDAAAVARLARAQERELRTWLFEGDGDTAGTVSGALRAAAAAVEDTHDVHVDVVTVGDAVLDDTLRPVVAAAGEALGNAARHAGVDRVDVYAEVDERSVEVFVRDRGGGFDLAAVPLDRHGVRHSIIDRMQRHGGTAEVRTTPGAGTEVRLHLPRTPQEDP